MPSEPVDMKNCNRWFWPRQFIVPAIPVIIAVLQFGGCKDRTVQNATDHSVPSPPQAVSPDNEEKSTMQENDLLFISKCERVEDMWSDDDERYEYQMDTANRRYVLSESACHSLGRLLRKPAMILRDEFAYPGAASGVFIWKGKIIRIHYRILVYRSQSGVTYAWESSLSEALEKPEEDHDAAAAFAAVEAYLQSIGKDGAP